MVSTKPKVTRKTVLLPIIGLVAFFLYIYLFKVDIPAIIATAQRADPIIYSAHKCRDCVKTMLTFWE